MSEPRKSFREWLSDKVASINRAGAVPADWTPPESDLEKMKEAYMSEKKSKPNVDSSHGTVNHEPLIGYMILEDCAEDFSHWDGVITGPDDPTGANLAWQDPIKMIEFAAYECVCKERDVLQLRDAHITMERDGLLKQLAGERERAERFKKMLVEEQKDGDQARAEVERLKEKDAELIRVLDELLGSGNRVNPHLGVAAGASLLKTRVERLQAALERAKEIIKHQTLIDRTPSLLEEIEKLEHGIGATGAEKAQSAAAKERGE